MLRYLTAGESHGPALTAIVEGFPSGVPLDTALIDGELRRRQGGYGRGKRQALETDRVIVDSGVYHGETTGGPITLRLVNNDAKLQRLQQPAAPRGGHIDLAGAINHHTGIRQVLAEMLHPAGADAPLPDEGQDQAVAHARHVGVEPAGDALPGGLLDGAANHGSIPLRRPRG